MGKPSRIRRFLKWTLRGLTLLVLLGVACAPWSETHISKAVSIQMADGVLTIRSWGTAGGIPQGIPSDDPAKHPRGIPDSRSIPLWILLLALVVPTALLWWVDRRSTAPRAPPEGNDRADRRTARCQARS